MIVTAKARWILMLAFVAIVYGLFAKHVLLIRVAVTILIWIGLEWAAFRYHADFAIKRMTLERSVSDRQGEAKVLWATRSTSVSTKLRSSTPWLMSFLPTARVTAHDLLPTGLELVDGENGCRFLSGQHDSIRLKFSIRPAAPGMVRFSGVRFVLEDLHGFFVAERFRYLPRNMRVMPLALTHGTITTVRKRANVLPPPGVHTVGRAGLGSELLEIREYQPGDPPRSIAWKVSARRDELMSKQFETEVPVRCQMLVDMSRAVRLGYPGPCLGGRLVSIASTIAFTLTAQRDPVGVSMFNGDEIQIVQSSASRKAALRTVDTLCTALDKPIAPVGTASPHAIRQLIRSGFDVARMRYPEAMQYAEGSLASWWPSRTITRIRRRLAAVLTNHYELEETAMGELEGNDEFMSYWLQRFHTEHGAPYTGELYDKDGKYLFADKQKIEQLAQLLRRYASRGRDNELFVILAELTSSDYDLAPLVDAIKFAKARHHRVAVLVAWPARMPGPTSAAQSSLDNQNLYTTQRKQEQAYARLRSEFGKLAVPISTAAHDNASVMVLNQLEILRSGRTVS